MFAQGDRFAENLGHDDCTFARFRIAEIMVDLAPAPGCICPGIGAGVDVLMPALMDTGMCVSMDVAVNVVARHRLADFHLDHRRCLLLVALAALLQLSQLLLVARLLLPAVSVGLRALRRLLALSRLLRTRRGCLLVGVRADAPGKRPLRLATKFVLISWLHLLVLPLERDTPCVPRNPSGSYIVLLPSLPEMESRMLVSAWTLRMR
jgi:hypothetical protein